jgi:hypothetical protein
MSTGLDCHIYEKNLGEWYYDLEKWSDREMYDTYGPFPTLRRAENDLANSHANPGGYSIDPHPSRDPMDSSWEDE